MRISTILDRIDSGSIALPEFQRGYVWNRAQVRKLMHSLYRGYPIGSLLMWETKTEEAKTKGEGELAPGVVNLLLDGQQRVTTLYGIIRGKPPLFFEGDPNTFTGLFFNLASQEFEFYGPIKMRDDPKWIDVTELLQIGVGQFISRLVVNPMFQPQIQTYIDRLNSIGAAKERDIHVETVTGEDKTVDVVVDIFNEVNSGGTKLSKGDLALAKVCASWSDARREMRKRLEKWHRAGYNFKPDWLLRCITTVTTGEALFTALENVQTAQFREGLTLAEKHVDTLLNLIAGRLGLDYDQVLGSRYAFPLLASYLHQRNGRLAGQSERDQLLYWYVHTMLWGRYSGSTESTLGKDLAAIKQNEGALERLIEELRQDRGDLRIRPQDFRDWGRNSRFYSMLYMLTRVWHARDWESGIELTAHLLGKTSGLQLHHIFPKALLYKAGYTKPQVNALANFTFLTQDTNLVVSDRDPSEYLPHFAQKHPGVLESHWIPTDPSLWRIENYPEFLMARQELLAEAANEFLDSLKGGQVPEQKTVTSVLERTIPIVPGSIDGDDEEELIQQCNGWIIEQGLAPGEDRYELVSDSTKEVLAYFDLAWPDGVQLGRTQPVALLLNESDITFEVAQKAGYRYFTTLEDFKQYVIHEVLEQEPVVN